MFDNPLETERLPKSKPPFEFPAVVYYPTRDQINTTGGLLFMVIVFSLGGILLGRTIWATSSVSVANLHMIAQFGFLVITTAYILRPWLRWWGIAEAMAVIGLAQTTLILAVPPLTPEFCPLLTGFLLAWAANEMSLHWITINPAESNSSKRMDSRYVFLSGIFLACLWIIKNHILDSQAFVTVLILAGLLWMLTLVLHFRSGYSFSKLLVHGLTSFFNYPDSANTPPGLIASPGGAISLRPLPWATFLLAFCGGWLLNKQEAAAADFWQSFLAATSVAAVLMMLVVVVAATPIATASDAKKWQAAVEANSNSQLPLHRDSLYIGTVAADGSPVQVDRSLVMEHVHLLGATGAGKTSMGLVPLIEQLLRPGNASVIVIDLKGDSLELLAAAHAANVGLRNRTGRELPLRVFTLESGTKTFGFNPLLTTGWRQLSILERTDVICNALGLNYGLGYAREFFTSCNSAPILGGSLANPDAMSLRQLHRDVEHNLRSANPLAMMPEMKRSAMHAWYTLSRMAMLDAINVTGPRLDTPDVMDHQIDLASFYTIPQIAHFKLPVTTAPTTAPAIARLVAHFLLVAGKHVQRKNKVYLVVDEFQKMATEGLDQLFQMARSLDVGIVLANQSMSDLTAANVALAGSIEANCHWRQWFSIGNQSELEALSRLFGTREEVRYSTTYTNNGMASTARIEEVPRATLLDLQSFSDDPSLSILKITGDRKGYGKYRGIPFVVRSAFHITQAEYEQRKKYQWPDDWPGMMVGCVTPPERGPHGDAAQVDFSDVKATEPESWNSELFE